MKIVCQLDSLGYFVSGVTADPSPLESGVFLIPGGAVDFPIPTIPDGKRAKWNGSGFDLEDIPIPDVADEPAPPTPEELLRQVKRERAAAVAAIKVTTASGKVFDGDEVSQTRMARAIIAIEAMGVPSVVWVLANNVPTEVTLAELTEALALAGAAQAAVWSAPYQEA